MQFKIVQLESSRPVGLVVAYNVDFRNQVGHMALLLDPAVQMHGWAMEAPILFLEYVFNTWPLRKIYMETYEFNYASIQSGADRMFEVEGCLLDYEFQDGEYWHKYILAVSRERWQSIAERLRRLVRPVRPDRGAPRDHEVG